MKRGDRGRDTRKATGDASAPARQEEGFTPSAPDRDRGLASVPVCCGDPGDCDCSTRLWCNSNDAPCENPVCRPTAGHDKGWCWDGILVPTYERPSTYNLVIESGADATLVLGRAAALVQGDRQEAYGHPLPNHERIARLWNARLHEKLLAPLEPEDVTALMRLAKEARLIESPGHLDSLVDLAGYAEAEAMIHEALDPDDA